MRFKNKGLLKFVTVLLIAVTSLTLFVGCDDILDNIEIEDVEITQGIYYKGSDGAVCDEWVKILPDKKWTDSENASGYFAVNASIVRFYDSNDELFTFGVVNNTEIKFFSSEDVSDIENLIATYTLNPNIDINNIVATKIEATYKGGLIYAGDELKNSDFEVKVFYTDGTSEYAEDFSISGFESTVGEKTVQVEYNGFTDDVVVTVKEKVSTDSGMTNPEANPDPLSIEDIPEYTDEAYVVIRNNVPDFKADEMVTESFEFYSQLDSLGRCGYTVACVGIDIMPTEERDSIGSVKPSGWQTVKYDIVSGKYLYNRCHLIGFQLTGENANICNLITGTRYLNIDGMLPFENMVADYVKETGNHVLYRVTPIFVGNDLVARGVHMEGLSVEDNGEGICFNIFAYNVQPGITIDYATGNSSLNE